MGIFVKALENTIPPEMHTGAESIAMGAGSLAAAAAIGSALAGQGVVPALQTASNASLPGAGKTQELQIG